MIRPGQFREPPMDSFRALAVDRSILLQRGLEKSTTDVEDEQLQEKDFVDHYGPDAVKADLAYVAEMEAKFKSQSTPELQEIEGWSKVLEAVIIEQAEQNEWLGPNAHTRRALRFDDIKNGVDVITEIEQDNATSHLALAVDITHGQHLHRKIERIRREIEQGGLTTVKYFESSSGEFKGQLRKVPRVVIGADRDTLEEVARLWLDRKNRDLASHPIQCQILDEIQLQLEAFAKYARKVGREEVAAIYDKQLRILGSIRSAKTAIFEKVVDVPNNYLENDRVFRAISNELEQL